MKEFLKKTRNKGLALAEIVIGSAIILSGILAISSAYTIYLKYALANQRNVEANYLLAEGLEVMGFFRDDNYSNIATDGTYYLSWSGTIWATTTTPEYVDGKFSRSITVAPVYRDGDFRIAESGTADSDSKFITATVSYFQGQATTTRSVSSYLTNLNSD